jgi:hypothetical protein
MSHGDRVESNSSQSAQSTLRSVAGPDYANPSASSTTSGSNSTPLGINSSSTTQQSNSPPEDERIRTLSRLEESIESFRKGKTSKTSAVSSILRILGENTNVSFTQSQKDASFDSYLAEILAIQSTFDESSESSPERPETSEQPSSTSNNPSKRTSQRAREDVESESDDDDKPTKKQKLLESEMPWFTSVNISHAENIHPSCEETCRLLRAYNRDISGAKFFVKIAPNSPTGIPSSQWERILKGEAVDLNQIFASLHHIIPDEERTGRLGDTEISFGVSEAKKKIRTASEWASAWRRASRAIGFAFPHRREELLEYGDYIESEFAAKLPSAHHKLILYDVALRNEVGAGQHFLLTDIHRFSRLYSAIILPDGVEGNSQPTTKRVINFHQNGGKPEICNKFNLGSCKQSDANCKYRHLCKTCKKPGHPSRDCTEGSK